MLTPVIVPIQVLERYVFEKISVRGRALAAAVDLVGAIDGFDKSVKYRNDLIAEIGKESPVQADLLTLSENTLAYRNLSGIG